MKTSLLTLPEFHEWLDLRMIIIKQNQRLSCEEIHAAINELTHVSFVTDCPPLENTSTTIASTETPLTSSKMSLTSSEMPHSSSEIPLSSSETSLSSSELTEACLSSSGGPLASSEGSLTTESPLETSSISDDLTTEKRINNTTPTTPVKIHSHKLFIILGSIFGLTVICFIGVCILVYYKKKITLTNARRNMCLEMSNIYRSTTEPNCK